MKKNVLRVISLILVAGMLLAFCSCTQEILVRFVDKDGNDLDLGGISIGGGSVAANSAASSSSSSSSSSAATPAATEAPAADNSGDSAAAPAADNSGDSAAAPAASTGKPSTKDEVLDFYKAAAARIKDNAEAGYHKKEWQVIGNLNITGMGAVDSAIENVVAGYATTEENAEDQVQEKGSDEAKNRFPGFTLTDYSKVASAECTEANGNYKIKIVMQDEDTPKKSGNFLGEVTNSVLYWEDIETEVKTNVSIVKSFSDVHVNYQHFTIEAEITPDGKFVSMDQTAHVDIQIGEAKIMVISLKNKSGTMDNYAQYRDFSY